MQLKGWLVGALALGLTISLAGNARAGQGEQGRSRHERARQDGSGLATLPMPMSVEEAAEKTVSVPELGYELGEIEPEACTTGGATFTWTVTDSCPDGQGDYLRFFDLSNHLVWPDANHVYTLASGRTVVYRLSVKRGAKICYGATPWDADGYWGVDVDGSSSCSTCCSIVPNSGNPSRNVKLTC
jgi:hypothetical protein